MLFAPDAFRDAVARFVVSWPVCSVIAMLGAAGVLAVKRFDDYDMLARMLCIQKIVTIFDFQPL